MAKAGELKDLEAYILGLIAECRSCSPYFIHKTFLSSPSLFFSGSAGAIYPAVKRLQKRGLLKAERSGTRDRPSKSLSITTKGREEYLKWFFDPVRAGDAGFDPLRGRVSLMGGLPKKFQDEAAGKLVDVCQKRLALIESLMGKDYVEAGMVRALQLEHATLAAKLKVLRGWAKED